MVLWSLRGTKMKRVLNSNSKVPISNTEKPHCFFPWDAGCWGSYNICRFCWDSQLDTLLWNPVKRWVGCPKAIVERPRSKAKRIAWQCRRIRRVKRDSPGWVQCQSYGNLDHFFLRNLDLRMMRVHGIPFQLQCSEFLMIWWTFCRLFQPEIILGDLHPQRWRELAQRGRGSGPKMLRLRTLGASASHRLWPLDETTWNNYFP